MTMITTINTGCNTLHKEQKPEFNPIVQDPHFQQAFSTKTIKLIAPASGTEPEKIQRLQTLNQFKMDVPENLTTQAIAFHSNTDEERFKALKNALLDTEDPNAIIWTLRGGYGTARLIQDLKQLPKPKHEKIFIGFSDITALHLFLSQHWQWKTIHGAGILEFLNPNHDPKNLQMIADIITKKGSHLDIKELKLLNPNPINNNHTKFKKITGRLTGGNLSIVQTSLGTPWQIKTRGKIVFLEDVSVKGYHIDRSLNHLKQAGVFKHAKAIVLGDFTNLQDDKIDLAIERFAKEMQVPVFKTDTFGHGFKNYPLIYNAASSIAEDPESGSFTLKMKI